MNPHATSPEPSFTEERQRVEQMLDFYGFLIQANSLVARADDIGKLYRDICQLGIHLDRHLVLAWVGMVAPDGEQVDVVASAGPASDYLDGMQVTTSPQLPAGRGPTGMAIREGRCVFVNRFLDDPVTQPWSERARQYGIAASAALPLRRHGKVCGALMLYSSTADFFDERVSGELEVLSQTLSDAIDASAERELRRHLDAQLMESQLTMRAILDAAHQSILMMSADGEILGLNLMAAERLGMSPQELVGRNLLEMLPPDLADRRRDIIAEVLRSGQPVTVDDARDGRNFQTTVYPVLEGSPRVVIYAEEVTERVVAEVRERNQTKRWLALLNLGRSGEYEGAQGEHEFLAKALEEAQTLTGSRVGFLHLISADQQSSELVAWTGAALNGHAPDLAVSYPVGKAGIWVDSFEEQRGLILNDFAGQAAAGGTAIARLIAVPVIADGKVRVIAWVGDKATPYDQDDLEFLQILATDAWRIVSRRRVEAELRDALQVVEASHVICYRLDVQRDYAVDYVSRNISRWGYSPEYFDLHGMSPFQLIHPDDRERVLMEMATYEKAGHDEYTQEYRFRTAEGAYRWVADRTRLLRGDDGMPLYSEGVITDIDEDKRREQELAESLRTQRALNRKLESAQSQLLQSEKMASIGQLAAGVAHELNNPIGFVNSNLGTLDAYLKSLFAILDACESCAATAAGNDDLAPVRAAIEEHDLGYLRTDIAQLLAESKDGLERVRKIVLDLKDFSRVGETEWQWTNLQRGIDSTLNIVWNELKYKCTVHKHYAQLPDIYCLPSQLNQVFMNLLVNAAQAIETKGEITIATECAGEDAVRVSITDTGHGIAPDQIKRIFEPFYTTKPVGKGTGLGLSMVWSIVERHKGRIEVASEVGKGTTFTITLPVEPVPDEGAGAGRAGA